jgi:hypothetical protein
MQRRRTLFSALLVIVPIVLLAAALLVFWMWAGPSLQVGTSPVTKMDFTIRSTPDVATARPLTKSETDAVVSALARSRAYRLAVQPGAFRGSLRIFHEDGSIDVVYILGETMVSKDGDSSYYRLPVPFSELIR